MCVDSSYMQNKHRPSSEVSPLVSTLHDLFLTAVQVWSKSFKLKSTLKQHQSDCHEINVRWHCCDNCDYKAKRAATLKQHRADVQDVDVQWFDCTQPSCSYRAKKKVRIRLHLAGIHNIGAKFLNCKVEGCDYKCKTHQSGNMRRHLSNKHDIGVKWASCPKENCTYRAKSRDNLRSHLTFKHNVDTADLNMVADLNPTTQQV